MILEYLQPDPSFLDGIAVVVRAFYYAATIGATGLAFFTIGYDHRLRPAEVTRLRRTLVGAITAGLALSVGALALRVLVLTAGVSMTDSAVWDAIMRSRIGDAFWLRSAGLVLLAAAAMPWRAGPAIAAVGGVLVLGSYAAMGHLMLYQPRQEIAALVVLHLGVVAFWVGLLLPLLSVAQRPDGAETVALLHDWSRAATVAVAAMIATGVLLTWYLTVRLDLIFEAWHGMAGRSRERSWLCWQPSRSRCRTGCGTPQRWHKANRGLEHGSRPPSASRSSCCCWSSTSQPKWSPSIRLTTATGYKTEIPLMIQFCPLR